MRPPSITSLNDCNTTFNLFCFQHYRGSGFNESVVALRAQVTAMLTSQLPEQPQPPSPKKTDDEDEFLDSVTAKIIVDPVVGSNGCTYDRLTAYKLMTQGCNMPGCDGPFTFAADNLHFRGRLRVAHPETEEAMARQRQECFEVCCVASTRDDCRPWERSESKPFSKYMHFVGRQCHLFK